MRTAAPLAPAFQLAGVSVRGQRAAGRGAGVCGSFHAATRPTSEIRASTIIARAYDRPGVEVIPATRIVPPMAVPKDEPRFETLRDRPEISPCRSSPKLDWT